MNGLIHVVPNTRYIFLGYTSRVESPRIQTCIASSIKNRRLCMKSFVSSFQDTSNGKLLELFIASSCFLGKIILIGLVLKTKYLSPINSTT